jgi:hypothetical protein
MSKQSTSKKRGKRAEAPKGPESGLRLVRGPELDPPATASRKSLRMSEIGNVPVDGQSISIDARASFIAIDGLANIVGDVSDLLDSLEVELYQLDDGPSSQDPFAALRTTVRQLRQERVYLGASLDDLHGMIVGDAYTEKAAS